VGVRSGANDFPNSYVVSDPTRPIVTPNAAFCNPASYPFRRGRFRADLEREDVVNAEAAVRRDTIAGYRGAFKRGATVVARDKMQDRENLNYNGVGFTLADFGLGGMGPDDFFGLFSDSRTAISI
jgi:hypothetical protein